MNDKCLMFHRKEDNVKLFLPDCEVIKGEGGLQTKGYFKKSYKDKLLISIITVVYNGEEYLEETIQSVINQTYDNVEYIIIDGASTDGTLDIIKKYADKIDYWISEKDEGISAAFNKGILVASGKYLNFLNAGDKLLHKNILNNFDKYFINSDAIITGFSKFGNSTIPHKKLTNRDPLCAKSLLSHKPLLLGLSCLRNMACI